MSNYDMIMESFIGIEADLIAMEAEIDDNPTDTAEFNKVITDRVDKIVQRAIKKVDEEIMKLNDRKKALDTQLKAFTTEYNGLRNSYQPEKQIQIVNYEYDSNVLDQQESNAKALFVDGYNKIAGIVSNPDRITAKNNILGADYRRVVSAILDKYNTPKNITTPDGVYADTKNRFRGKKRVQTIGNGALNQYVTESKNVGNIVNNAATALNDVKTKISSISRVLDGFIRNGSNTQEHKKRLPKIVRNFISLANFYIGMIMYCFELRIEKVVNSRVIVKTFYKKENSKQLQKQKRIEEGDKNAQG